MVNFDGITGNEEDNDKTIDSPRENMAIYQYLMINGFGTELSFLSTYFSANDIMNLAIGALAAGSDKFGNITVDEIAYMNDWILDWEIVTPVNPLPDEKGRNYYNFGSIVYDRESTYSDKYVKITTLYPDGTWSEEIVSLFDGVPSLWTSPERLIDYSGNTNITGFANAVDDAIQVLEYIHESDLIVYSPYFAP